MPTIVVETRIAAPIERCFDLARDLEAHVKTCHLALSPGLCWPRRRQALRREAPEDVLGDKAVSAQAICRKHRCNERPVTLSWFILFVELFPAFVTIVAAIAGIALYIANRNHDP